MLCEHDVHAAIPVDVRHGRRRLHGVRSHRGHVLLGLVRVRDNGRSLRFRSGVLRGELCLQRDLLPEWLLQRHHVRCGADLPDLWHRRRHVQLLQQHHERPLLGDRHVRLRDDRRSLRLRPAVLGRRLRLQCDVLQWVL